jgi:hypothetical protein
MTNKRFNQIATVVFYLAGLLAAGLVLVSWHEAEIPPAAEPVSEVVESISGKEQAIPLPINDREPQNFAQPTADAVKPGESGTMR